MWYGFFFTKNRVIWKLTPQNGWWKLGFQTLKEQIDDLGLPLFLVQHPYVDMIVCVGEYLRYEMIFRWKKIQNPAKNPKLIWWKKSRWFTSDFNIPCQVFFRRISEPSTVTCQQLDGLDPFGWVGLMMVDVKAQKLKFSKVWCVYLHFHKKKHLTKKGINRPCIMGILATLPGTIPPQNDEKGLIKAY